MTPATLHACEAMNAVELAAWQSQRRRELWGLLGDLPSAVTPSGRVLQRELREGYVLEHLELELNGIQAVPALMLIPNGVQSPAPAVLYMHWHGSDYDTGKNELLLGRPVLPAYAPVFAEKGIVALAIDSWCFGERRLDRENGRRGEEDAFKEMLWKGQVLWGAMVLDEWQAINYLCTRPEVDSARVGVFGISMGATKAWWLAALDERIRCCIDLCCLTDYADLIANRNLSRHGLYYYVPRLLKHFDACGINELIVPRARLSLNGRRDSLTPPEGVERIREHLLGLYERYGRPEDCRIELFDCEHEETPAMRALVAEWMDRHIRGTRGPECPMKAE